VLAISGSLRRSSYNSTLLAAAATAAPPGVEFVRWRGLEQVPPYNADRDRSPAPAAVAALRRAIAASDAVLIATPEYNASIPGALKNALDWVSRPFPHNCCAGRRSPSSAPAPVSSAPSGHRPSCARC
jgi:chromate reductase, NAD(P)H dehydrogenase (quinone)